VTSKPTELSFAEHVCLALVVEGVSHGWAIGTMLAPDGELGRIWSLSRALTYRAVDGLVDKGMVTRRGQTAGQGRDRVVLAARAAGRRASAAWLDEPVPHLRDVRTELLVKLTLRSRAGLANDELLAAQQAHFDPMIEVLCARQDSDDVVDLWRRESARAVGRFLEQALHPGQEPGADLPEGRLRAVLIVTTGEVVVTTA
jgi:DNA-binding PadR family transcriptional regulator